MVARERQNLPAVNQEEVHQALARILNSKHFAHASKKQKFLRLICDFYLSGRTAELNEYLIGCEVFDRKEDYNPATDPIVRVGAHELRKKLELYYQQEGASDELRLDIPVGSYEPIFIRSQLSPAPPGQPVQPAPSIHPTKKETARAGVVVTVLAAPFSATVLWKKPVLVLSATVAVLLMTSFVLLYLNSDLRRQVRKATAPQDRSVYGSVWQPFLNSEEPTLLVLSNPVVYRLLNAGDAEPVAKKSVGLTPEQAATLTQVLKDYFAVRHSPPSPRLVLSLDTYTGMGEAIGVQRVTDLLRTTDKQVLLKRSRTVSAEDLRDHHVILLGSVWANEWSGKLQIQEDFVVTNQATIENHHPLPGEEKVYRSRFDERTQRLREDYALITVKPNISEGNVIMVLAGLRSAGTEAAAEYVTSKARLSELNQSLGQMGGSAGPPRYYQVLLKVGVEDGIPTTISLVTIHELRGAGR